MLKRGELNTGLDLYVCLLLIDRFADITYQTRKYLLPLQSNVMPKNF